MPMTRIEFLARCGISEGSFATLASRGQLPFAYLERGSERAGDVYTDENADRLVAQRLLVQLGMTARAARQIASTDLAGALSIAEIMTACHVASQGDAIEKAEDELSRPQRRTAA